MTPLQEFRLWARRAPTSERAAAGVAAALAVTLLALLLVPSSGRPDGPGGEMVFAETRPPAAEGNPGTAAADTAGGVEPEAAPGTTAVIGGTGRQAGDGSARRGSAASASAAATDAAVTSTTSEAAGCSAPPGSPRGVTSTQIKISVTLTNIVGPAANSVFGVATPDEQRRWYEAVIGAINAEGGVACRKLVPQFFLANPVDQNELQRTCLDIVQAGVFAEIDNGSYANFPQKQCFAQHQIPYFGSYILTRSEVNRFYPYLFNLVEYDTLGRNTILALEQVGFFDRAGGFGRLGWLYQDCDKGLVDAVRVAMEQAGLPQSAVVTYNLGCPSAFASPSDLAQAILRFRQNGVTHLTFTHDVGDFANFTNLAQQQGFRPNYGVPDEFLIDISYGSQRPNADNIAGAVAVTANRSGEERTPGISPTPGTARCDAIYRAHGLPPTYRLPAGAGYVCSQLWMFKAAVENAPRLAPDALAAGLQRARSVELSYPAGPNDFSGPRVTTGGQFWRLARFERSCSCWRVTDPTFRPSFP